MTRIDDIEHERQWEEAERAKLQAKAEERDAHARDRVHYMVAMAICRRWEAAGYTTASLVDGLPSPEKPHAADWQGEGRFRHCGTCGRTHYRAPLPPTCPGMGAFNLVYQALGDGVPFGLVDGLPTAGVRPEPGDVAEKLARATCRPMVRREERQAA